MFETEDLAEAAASARIRVVTWADPADMSRAAGMTGLEIMTAIADGRLPSPPISSLVGFERLAVDEGTVTVTLVPTELHYNPLGSVHGGIISTLLDTVAGCAVQTTLPAGTGYTTLDLSVKFLRAVTTRTGPVTATGEVVHRGSRTALAHASLTDGGGRLLATASSTCLVLPA
jgi:uncharacterized protein (TIGR00369 family)